MFLAQVQSVMHCFEAHLHCSQVKPMQTLCQVVKVSSMYYSFSVLSVCSESLDYYLFNLC